MRTPTDISTPQLLRDQIIRAMHNKGETRKLLVAIGACPSGRKKYAGKTFSQAWQTASGDDLYWVIARLRQRLYPGGSYTDNCGVLDRLNMIARQLHPRRGFEPTRATLFRAWFGPTGELRQAWNL